MTAPMIDVQGNLLLPTLYPLSNQAVTFGREWASAHARPAFSEYEVPFYAAKLLTAYVSALALRDSPYPYAPSNLWNKLSRTEFEAFMPRATAASVTSAAPAKAAAPFEPFAADLAGPRVVAPIKRQDNSKLVGGAIALASVGLLAWLMFGVGPTRKDESGRAELTHTATPASTPTATPAAPASYAPATASAFPAANEPVVPKVVEAAKPVAAIPVDLTTQSEAAPVSKSVPASASASVPASRLAVSANAGAGAVAEPETADLKAVASQRPKSKADDIYPVTSRGTKKALRTSRQSGIEALRSKQRGSATSANSTRDAAYDRLVAMRESDDVIEQDNAYRRPARAAARQPEAPAARADAQQGLSVAEMYNMLQHSPTLDDNSSLARSGSHGRASAFEPSSGGNVRLSKERVTDAPGDFTK